MKCTLTDCPGEYQPKLISQVFTREGESVVIEGIPVLVCDTCGDTILSWETMEQLFKALEAKREPTHFLPVYTFDDVES